MTQTEILSRLYKLSGHMDFLVILSRDCHNKHYGEYYPKFSVIVIYTLDENGVELSEEEIMRTAIHEMTHHVLIQHTKGYTLVEGDEHDQEFKEKFANYLDMYYNGAVPISTIQRLKEGGMWTDAIKKKGLRRVTGSSVRIGQYATTKEVMV